MQTLSQINEALLALGYETELGETHIAVKVHSFAAVLSINESNQLEISCQVAKVSELNEGKLAAAAFAALDANTRIAPYAFGIFTADEDGEGGVEEDVIVLIDSVPLGDFQKSELESSMDSLVKALLNGREVLKTGL